MFLESIEQTARHDAFEALECNPADQDCSLTTLFAVLSRVIMLMGVCAFF